jgi:hypothetical protein
MEYLSQRQVNGQLAHTSTIEKNVIHTLADAASTGTGVRARVNLTYSTRTYSLCILIGELDQQECYVVHVLDACMKVPAVTSVPRTWLYPEQPVS